MAQWLSSLGVSAAAISAARPEALVWALERGSRSGRVAYQFARDFMGRDGGEQKDRRQDGSDDAHQEAN